MSLRSLLRRPRALPAVAATALVLSLAACGSGSEDGTDAAGSASGAFPVSVKSSLGTAEITDEPQRVVTLGQGSAETAIALGTTPVAMERYDWGADDTGYLPWVHEAVTERGDDLPTLLKPSEQLDVEEIAAQRPDVILAVWSGITQDQYDLLSKIAPTVAYPDLAWSTDWDEQIDTVATALGKADRADDLKTDITDRLEAVADEHPEYAEHTFAYLYNTGPGTLGAFLEDEQRVSMLRTMGLRLDPVVDTFEETEGTDSAVLSLENAADFEDTDLIFTFYSDPKNKTEVEAQPVYASIPAIERGSTVVSTDQSFVTASSIINPLTVPWMIDQYVPLIDEAIAKVGS
ncbi:iron-siderophore ABC transporter substrate-binding protein [Solicola sp. PLA-1-18]|uniref:iron-siderophore ABC transporter substrate-binding protein n=1 Tax=Solicola sp. PLA-1-18 TaxID=3380532 RepID=UPI003B7E856D